MPETLLKVIPFLLLSLLPQFAFSSEIQGRVPGVCDGEPITVLNNGHAEALRLNGIDCPEKGQDFGARGKQLTSRIFVSEKSWRSRQGNLEGHYEKTQIAAEIAIRFEKHPVL